MNDIVDAIVKPEEQPQDIYANLSFARLRIPKLIPKDLIENVKGRTFTPDQFYDYQEMQVDNPYNFLYAIINENKKIQGYFWAELNLLDQSLFINTISVNKSFWGKGRIMPKITRFLSGLKDSTNASRIFWITTNDKFFEKHGFKKSKNVLMEYNED